MIQRKNVCISKNTILLFFILLAVPSFPILSWAPVTIISTYGYHQDFVDECPGIAIDFDGNSYITWYASKESNVGIYWTKINHLGIKEKILEISVYPAIMSGHGGTNPDIAVDSSGNSYITWFAYDGTDYEIYWVKIDILGNMGIIQKISTHPNNVNGDDYWPEIDVDSSGNSYITWCGDFDIYWVKVDSSGNVGIAQMISIHPENIETEMDPVIRVDSLGNSYIAYTGAWTYNCPGHEIYWVKVDSLGNVGIVQKISTHPDNVNGDDWFPEIDIDSSGNSYVVWECNIRATNESQIYWTKINASGVPGIVKKISTHPDNFLEQQLTPEISVDSLGNSFVTWFGYVSGIAPQIYWVKVDNYGTPGIVKKISTHPDNINGGGCDDPKIGIDSLSNSYIIYHGFDPVDISPDGEIYWVKVDSSGIPGVVHKISTHPNNKTNHDECPVIAVDPSGGSYVAWRGQKSFDWEPWHDWDIYFTLSIDGEILSSSEANNKINEEIRPLTHYNISMAEALSLETQELIFQATQRNLDTSECKDIIEEAEKLLSIAKEYYRGMNYIPANNFVLEAMDKYLEVIAILKNLLV